MRRIVIIVSLLLISLLVAACDSGGSTELPTLAISPTDAESDTPAPPTATPLREELPATWTPAPIGGQAQSNSSRPSNTPRATNTLSPDEPTLPATWTMVPTLNQLQGGSSNRDMNRTATFLAITPSPTITETPVNDLCYIFAPDDVANRLTETIISGTPVTIFWIPIPVPGYSYEIRLFFQDGSQLVTANTAEGANSFTFEQGILNAQNGVYGWEVQPLFNLVPDCYPITGEIFVQAPLEQ